MKLRLEWKIKFSAKALLIKCNGISFRSWEFWSYSFLTQEHCKLDILLDMSTISEPPFWKSLQIVLHLIFPSMEFHGKFFCIRCMVVLISLEINKTCAKNTNFNKANILKILILLSRVKVLCHQILKTVSVPIIVFLKFCFSSIFLLYKKFLCFYCIFS